MGCLRGLLGPSERDLPHAAVACSSGDKMMPNTWNNAAVGAGNEVPTTWVLLK